MELFFCVTPTSPPGGARGSITAPAPSSIPELLVYMWLDMLLT